MARRALLTSVVTLWAAAAGLVAAEPAPSPGSSASPAKAALPTRTGEGASYEVRLKNARTARVTLSILGVQIGDTMKKAHEKLDKLAAKDMAPGAGATSGVIQRKRKVVWQLSGTDFSTVYAKGDNEGKIVHLEGIYREEKRPAFDKIGDTKKAPILTDFVAAWDVVRPERPQMRVIARGTNRVASTLTIFVSRGEGGDDD